MHNELTNLLSRERWHALRRDYFLRLGTAAALLASGLVWVTGVLLFPTYVFLAASAHTKEARLATIDSTLSSVSEKTISSRLAALSGAASILTALASAPSVSDLMRAVLAISRPGITLSGFIYTPAAGKNAGTLAISGMATTRDALRSYQIALQSASFASSADLPVSAYAKDSTIPFTITVTLSP